MSEENKSILHELYVYSEWKPEPEYIQKPDNLLLPENISSLWKWLKFFGPKKNLIDSVTAHKENHQKWHIALGDEGKVIAVLTDNILEIRTKRSDYATIAARTTVNRDPYSQWRKLVWSPDCSFVVLAYGNGVVGFFDLTASNLFNIPIECSRPEGLECSDNTHAVADVIFMPLRVKDTKWNWEVLIVTYDGKLRGYLVSQTEGFKIHHTFKFSGGVSAVAYSDRHSTLYVAGVPRGSGKDPSSPLSAGLTAWRILNDDPFYKLSVVSDELEAQLANQRFQLYIPFVTSKNLAFIVQMQLSPDATRLVCLHCNGDVSVWRLPLLKAEHRWPLDTQPLHDLRNPLSNDDKPTKKDPIKYYVADVNWWSGEEIIVSRFSGAVSVCPIQDMMNILGKKPEFFQGAPRITCAHEGTFMVLECESNVLPAKKSRSDESMEVVSTDNDEEDTMFELTKELLKSVLFAITDIETFQPKPKRITVVSRVYRLLGVKSTTPAELFSRKIESGKYTEALALAEEFGLDSDLVYQQQWRKNPVSTEAIQKYLSKVSKKIWAVHQCVDRLPETLPAAKELLQFGIQLTNERILDEINTNSENKIEDPDNITLEHLNAYTSELLRCRHVMLFYRDRLALYEAILRCEKSTYVKDEYDRLRSNSIVHSAAETAKEGRVEALTCLWPQIKTVPMQLAVLEKLPETINPIDYQHLLPTKQVVQWFEKKSPIKLPPSQYDNDWCRKGIFRSIWSSNWSEDCTPDVETVADVLIEDEELGKWYEKRAREIEERSGMVSHSLTLVTIAMVGGGVQGLDKIMFHLMTLDTLVYDINIEGVTLKQLEGLPPLEICTLLMKTSTAETFVSDLKQYVIPYLKRLENRSKVNDVCINGLIDYLVHISIEDLSPILLVLQSPTEFALDVCTHLDLVEKCFFAYTGTDLEKANALLDTIPTESDGSMSTAALQSAAGRVRRACGGWAALAARGVRVSGGALRDLAPHRDQAHALLLRLARALPAVEEKPTAQDWEKLLKDILNLQSSLFTCISKTECYEIYATSLLTSGHSPSVRLAADVMNCSKSARGDSRKVPYPKALELVLAAATEYVNSASGLEDPALDIARTCLMLIKEKNVKKIEEELDLISSFQILNSFEVPLLPIQVRLCEDRLSLVEQCLRLDLNGYLAGPKLLKLATLLRVAGDDEHTREGEVLSLIGKYALEAGARPPAARPRPVRRRAHLLPREPDARHAHCSVITLQLTNYYWLSLELESLQQTGVFVREQQFLTDRWPSTDDEFADAITTPVIERKDIVPTAKDKKPPRNYVLNTFQYKYDISEKSSPESAEVRYPEWYARVYGGGARAGGDEVPAGGDGAPAGGDGGHYSYGRFAMERPTGTAHALLSAYYIQNCLEHGYTAQLEAELVQKCGEELLYRDTPLSVACLLRSTQEYDVTKKFLESQHTDAAVSCALYATLVHCNSAALRDDVYLTKPTKMARMTLKQKNASEVQLKVINECVDKLTGMGEVAALRNLGVAVNGLLFNVDDDYRRELIYRLAGSKEKKHVEVACSLADKYGLDALEMWLAHAGTAGRLAAPPRLAARLTADLAAYNRIREVLWPQLRGDDHSSLINFFTLLKGIDEKQVLFGMTVMEHIKLLKKAKAASPELDYKLLLEPGAAERLSAHLVDIMRPENVGIVGKFLRTLPPAFKTPISINSIYTKWLTKHFFSVPSNATNKKWMQQYRQCSSYFNKLSKEDLLQFVADTCFSDDAVQRVPAGTRSLMILQAVDYCQQEQENDHKSNKSEQTWAQVGQELTRWARFLENFHSSSVQAIIDSTDVPRDTIWPEIEKSHGDAERVVSGLARLVLRGGAGRAPPLAPLLQCLHVPAPPAHVLRAAAQALADQSEAQILVERVVQYHKEGVKLPPDVLDEVVQSVAALGLAPHRLAGVLALSGERGGGRGLRCGADLLREHWPHRAAAVTEEALASEEGRRELFEKFLEESDTWQQRKALVDVLNCWPPITSSESASLQCEYLYALLTNPLDSKESLELIKALLSRPVLSEQEIKWLIDDVVPDAVVNAIWILLLSKYQHSKEEILNILQQHKEEVAKQEIDDELVAELLRNDLFVSLVGTPLYPKMLSYIISREGGSEDAPYSVPWATRELLKANYLAEAGHLRLMADGVPPPLRGFSQSVLYCKNIFKK
ncbi:NBAS subunit of NRZ tethering complex [Bombyx mori]|uniref:NBAS subunit of NRZ tethering complex n=1 Tax=Bombyx mori TaxID=7091 RepID=UPI002ED6822C